MYFFLPSTLICVGSSDPTSYLSSVEVIKSNVAIGPLSSDGAIFFSVLKFWNTWLNPAVLQTFSGAVPGWGLQKQDLVKILLFGAKNGWWTLAVSQALGDNLSHIHTLQLGPQSCPGKRTLKKNWGGGREWFLRKTVCVFKCRDMSSLVWKWLWDWWWQTLWMWLEESVGRLAGWVTFVILCIERLKYINTWNCYPVCSFHFSNKDV